MLCFVSDTGLAMLITSKSNGGDTEQQALQLLWNDMILRTK